MYVYIYVYVYVCKQKQIERIKKQLTRLQGIK